MAYGDDKQESRHSKIRICATLLTRCKGVLAACYGFLLIWKQLLQTEGTFYRYTISTIYEKKCLNRSIRYAKPNKIMLPIKRQLKPDTHLIIKPTVIYKKNVKSGLTVFSMRKKIPLLQWATQEFTKLQISFIR